MSSPLFPCRSCGKTRSEVEFRHRRRFCIECENAPVRKCHGCKRERLASAFNQKHDRKHPVCHSCRYAADREGNLRRAKARHRQLRDLVFKAYGGVCACCGEHRETMLTIDHVNNDGAAHRKKLSAGYKKHKWRDANLGGTSVYADLVRRNFPTGFQLLCANCNVSKARNGGVCEHHSEGATTIPKGSTAKRPEAPNAPNGAMI